MNQDQLSAGGPLNLVEPQKVRPSDWLRLWLQLQPKHMGPGLYNEIKRRGFDLGLTAFTSMSIVGFFVLFVTIALLPDRTAAPTSWWIGASVALHLAILATIGYFRLRHTSGMVNVRAWFWTLLALAITSGTLWGTLPRIISDDEPNLRYLSVSVTTVIGLLSYFWLFGQWLCGHAFALTLTMATAAGEISLQSTSTTLILTYASVFLITVGLLSLLLSTSFNSVLLSQIRIESQAEVIDLALLEFEEGAQDWLWEVNDSCRLTHVPVRMKAASKYSHLVAVGLPFFDCFANTLGRERLIGSMKQGKTYSQELVRLEHPKDPDIWWSLSGKPIFATDGSVIGYRGIGSDVSAARRLAAAESSKQRHDNIVRLTGSIAHDFNNILATTMGSLDLASRRIEKVHPAQSFIDVAQESCVRARNITSELLSFAAQDSRLEAESFDVGETILRTISAMSTASTQAAAINLSAPPGCFVFADRLQFERAMQNLLNNSMQAIDSTGQIDVRVVADHASQLVSISVSDTGPGISKDVLPQIFEPFFTTRRDQGGSGLGLSIAYGFAVQSDGALTAHNTPEGALFHLQLPQGNGEASPLANDLASSSAVIPPTLVDLQILLVEDDAHLAATLEQLLQDIGLQVTVSHTAASAITIIEANPQQFDLLISDIMLPDGRGYDIIARARALRPTIPALYVSGFADVRPEEIGDGQIPLLQKPFTMAELVQSLSLIDLDRNAKPH